MSLKVQYKRGSLSIIAAFLSVAWEGIRLLNGADWSWGAVGGRLFLVLVAMACGAWAIGGRRRWLMCVGGSVVVCLVAGWWDLGQPDTRVAWIGLAGVYSGLLALESAFAVETRKRGRRLAWLEYGVGLLCLVGIGGVTPVLLAQIESQFAEEEFFVAVQALFLSGFSLSLLLAQIVARRFKLVIYRESFGLRPLWGILGLSLVVVGGAWWGVRAYQASFYTSTAPEYEGIYKEAPFLCALLPLASASIDTGQVFERILARVEANPQKSTPEYGMLALATGERHWAEAFRKSILNAAEQSAFTGPSNSVKYGQRLAALCAYYLPQVEAAFPDLFSKQEQRMLEEWFAAINRRATTVEWVDWLYGLAFSFWPEGPYENQENGAGLLALLESLNLGDETLSEANRNYLARNVRGWAERFRNTDDAYLYQTEWIDSALFQETYQGKGPLPALFERNRRLSFEWLLLQTLPGGVPLTYNRPGAWSTAATLYLGGLLLEDPRYVWAAGQAVSALEQRQGYLGAQPGLESAARSELSGMACAPQEGSCLMFSPSGLPTQVGPLAPDKIVFRDGWETGATYLLLNLRFTGWHRYKATNGIISLYQGGPVVAEASRGESLAWLPIGRSLFRDKRIPRENLNGLLVSRSGFSQAVYLLSGLNGPWAQDPPHYAHVEGFYRLNGLEASHTVIEDWRGWDHKRTVYFFHEGPVIVVDRALYPDGGQGGLTWHLVGLGERVGDSLWLRRGDTAVRVAMPKIDWEQVHMDAHSGKDGDTLWDVMYLAPDAGQLELTTMFLMNGWAEASYDARPIYEGEEWVGQFISLQSDAQLIFLLHNALGRGKAGQAGQSVHAEGLNTDGLALIIMGDTPALPHTVCALGGSEVSLSLNKAPRQIRLSDGKVILQEGVDWQWRDGRLTLRLSALVSGCFHVDY